MSMMMPPDPAAAGGLPLPPGGGAPDQGLPPRGLTPSGPIPAGGGMDALAAALGGGGAGAPSDLGAPPGPEEMGAGEPGGPGEEMGPGEGALGDLAGAASAGSALQDMGPIDHIKAAMKHLMMAMASSQDDQHGQGIVKGMGALQAILGGEQKKAQMQGPGPVGG